jgi:tetratricopeptide (TPR) repeat protein
VPLYSIAEARRKRGKYPEAIAEVRKQLQRFPTDFQGWMLLAEIQAEDQLDVTGAWESIEQLLAQPGHGPKNIAFALSRCADWELKLREDPAAARRALERIVETLPETEQSQLALQRIAHLTTPELLAEQRAPHRIALKHFDNRLGLRTPSEPPQVEGRNEGRNEDLAEVAAAYVKRLEAFPADNETREKLAVLYAEHYQRLDLAEQELEQLVTAPNQLPKQVVHWLNLMADLQIKASGDVDRARQTLHRITDLFPTSAFAENALNRIAYLKLETRAQQKSQVVKLGSYEKDLGLK